MTIKIPEQYVDLFQSKAMGHVATIMADGRPQVTPVWIDYDGEYILFTSVIGRIKDTNMEARPQVAVEITDLENAYRYVSVQGRVVEISEEGAMDHIDKMSKRYIGQEKYPYAKEGEVRRLYKIAPEKVHGTRVD